MRNTNKFYAVTASFLRMNMVTASLMSTYRTTWSVTRAIRLYRRFKREYRRLVYERGEVSRYASSAGSFIILQGINLVPLGSGG